MLSDTTKLNRSFKATVGAAHTEDQRQFFQELFPYLLELGGGDVKTDLVPLPPVLVDDGDVSGVVQLYRRPLAPVPTTSNKVWAICDLDSGSYDLPAVWNPLTRRTHFIHPRYDTPLNGGSNNLVTSRYVVQLYRHAAGSPPYYEGLQIPPTATPDGSPLGGWEFEYESGLLYFTAIPTFALPLHIRVCRYTGTFGNFGGVGTVQKVFSTPYAYTGPLTVGDAVYVIDGIDDTVAQADSGDPNTSDAIGLVYQKDTPGPGQCIVQVAGEVSGVTVGGTPPYRGKRLFLGTAGALQDTAPTTGTVKSLGIARNNSVVALATTPLTIL